MKIKHYAQLTLVSALLTTPLPLLAGDLNSPDAPGNAGSAMCTLDDILNRPLTEICNDLWDTLMYGIPSPALVHATGETGSTGVAWPNPRFTDNSDGTVTDNLTGLIWLKDASCADLAGTDADGKANWATAKTAASSLANGTCGLSDNSSVGYWRLPSVNEQQSLAHYGFYNPAVPNTAGTAKWTTDGQPFSGVQSGNYWTATTYAYGSTSAWNVYLKFGFVYSDDKASTGYVWPVRGRP
jgi:hypothetical protein